MSVIKIQCVEQTLQILNSPEITSGNVNFDTVEFSFCSTWSELEKTAVFYRDPDNVYYQLLDSNNSCTIPKEVLTTKGILYIGVFGVLADSVLTSEVLTYRIGQGAITENIKPSDPTPDIYAQMLAEFSDVRSLYQDIKDSVDLIAETDERVNVLENAITKTTDRTLTSKPGGLKVNNIYGKSNQVSYSGAQLFNAYSLVRGSNTSLTIDNNGYTIIAKGGLAPYTMSNVYLDNDIIKGKTLYIQCDEVTRTQTNGGLQIDVTNSDGTHSYYDIRSSSKIKITIPDNAKSVNARVVTNNSSVALTTENTVTIKGAMISLNDVAWEPYVGATPSPNPEYPQDINSVGYENLVKIDCSTTTTNNLTFTKNADDSITVVGVPTETTTYMLRGYNITDLVYGEKYILSGCPAGGGNDTYILLLNSGDYAQTITCGGSEVSFSLSDANKTNFGWYIRVFAGVSINATFYPMIRKADVISAEYVPYGKTRLDIKSTPNLVKYLENGGVDIGSGTDMSSLTLWRTHYIDVIPNRVLYVYGYDISTTRNVRIFYYDKDKKYISTMLGTDYFNVTIPNNCYYIRLHIDQYVTNYRNIVVSYIPREEYGETSATIIIKNPLREGDRIVKINGVWKVERNTIEFGVDECYSIAESSDSKWYDSNISYSYELKQTSLGLKNNSLGLSTHFTSYTFGGFYEKAIETGCMNDQVYLVVNISKSLGICTTASEFKQWCIDNNVKFVKAITTPIYEELDTDSQIALNSLKTFDIITRITVNSLVDPEIDLEYGVTQAGAYSLEGLLVARKNEVAIADLTNAMLLLNQE